MDKHRFNYFFIILISFLSLVVFLVLKEANTLKLPDAQAYVPEYINTAPTELVNNDMAVSPDGELELTLKTVPLGTDINWNLILNGEKVSTLTLPVGWKVILPFNSFSPDNKYFFVKENSENEMLYKIFSTKGESLNKDGSDFELVALFNAQYQDLSVTDVTGWASAILLLVNTSKPDGVRGPTFWFDITSKKFIRLSRVFN